MFGIRKLIEGETQSRRVLGEWVRELSNALTEVRTKQDLILDHLKLKYVPESEKKEPAKLVPKQLSWSEMYPGLSIVDCVSGGGGVIADTTDRTSLIPTKKRGRPKKK